MDTLLNEENFIKILKNELLPALGCTEPIALAYCAAKAREVLGCLPDQVYVQASGNIIKNVKSVVVPNTNGLRGISSAIAAGITFGDAKKELEVLSSLTEDAQSGIQTFLEQVPITVTSFDDGEKLDMIVTLYKDTSYAKVRIAKNHTNIVLIEKNGQTLYAKELPMKKVPSENAVSYNELLTVKNIYQFITTTQLEKVIPILERQIHYNMEIAKEGIKHNWGSNIGSTLLKSYGNTLAVRAKAYAAAGSDARMNGCELPVVINSGSGNQGITVSVPVIIYARELGVSKDTLYRALLLSNLISIHIKSGIGPLSAFCGAVSAGCGAGCGIAYLYDADYETISQTLVNAIAITSGIICDGAKSSCAAKIASSVDAGILGYEMYKNGQKFRAGEGILEEDIEQTIKNIAQVGKIGMYETDKEIIRIMTKQYSTTMTY